MNTDLQLNKFPATTRIALNLWGFVGMAGVIWVMLHIERMDRVFFSVFVLVVVVPIFGLSHYAHRLYLRLGFAVRDTQVYRYAPDRDN